jgi:hypothetical protein
MPKANLIVLMVALTTVLVACGGGSTESSAPFGTSGVSTPSGMNDTSGTTGTSGSSGGSGASGTSPVELPLTLPIEVLSDGNPAMPFVAEAAISLSASNLRSASALWFICHRCGLYESPEFERTTATPVKVKASFRILGGQSSSLDAAVAWTDITDANVQLDASEAVQGGLNGGFYSTHITVPLDATTLSRLAVQPLQNRVQFRFNGTDGSTNGFRIVDLQIRDASGNKLNQNSTLNFDPLFEKHVASFSATDVAAGKQIWYGRDILKKSTVVDRTIHASCSNCHSEDARDLQYFNYSNNAIVQRSKFHGLSDSQAQQVVAFIRSSLATIPYVAAARPWNPPYQPGPGLCKATSCPEWAAGAGLGAVLTNPSDALAAVFGKPTGTPLQLTQADVDATMDPNATMNVRQIPVAMQFPDWNSWLPTTHPSDIWPVGASAAGSFDNGETFTYNGTTPSQVWNPNARYTALNSWFASHLNPNGQYSDWSHLTPGLRNQARTMIFQTGTETWSFLGGQRGNRIANSGLYGAQVGAQNMRQLMDTTTTAAGPALSFSINSFIERANFSVLHWNIVKQWELAQKYGLEGNQQWFVGTLNADNTWTGTGEAHGWPFNSFGLFHAAPHFIYQQDFDNKGNVTRDLYEAWQANDILGSYYSSNQWYQLQLTVNASGQSSLLGPIDWSYLAGFAHLLGLQVPTTTAAGKSAAQIQFIRMLQGRIKLAQQVNNKFVLWDPTNPNLVTNVGRLGRAETVAGLTATLTVDIDNGSYVTASPFKFLDQLSPGAYLQIVNGTITQFLSLYQQYPASAWRRCDPNNTQLGAPEQLSGFRFCLDASKQALGVHSDGTKFESLTSGVATTEQTEQYGLWKATQIGADPVRLQAWSTWINAVWP